MLKPKGWKWQPSILAWKIPWTEEPGVAKSRTRLSDFIFTFKGWNPGEEDGSVTAGAHPSRAAVRTP